VQGSIIFEDPIGIPVKERSVYVEGMYIFIVPPAFIA